MLLDYKTSYLGLEGKILSLKGKTVAITRSIEQAQDLADLITSRGGKPYVVPTVEIQPLTQSSKIREFIDKMIEGRIGLVAFMSQNAVTSLIDASSNMGLETKLLSALKKATIITIGPKTKKIIETYDLTSAIIPNNHSSDGIIGEIAKLDLKGKEVAIPRTDKASEYLKNELEKKSIRTFEFTVYQTVLPIDKSKVVKLLDNLLNGKVDVITFTSSSAAQNFFRIAQDSLLQDSVRKTLNEKVVVVSIGPVTQKTLEDMGVNVDVVPNSYTIEEMMAALDNYISQDYLPLENLDLTDRKLLQILQDRFPLIEKPWEKIGDMLQVSEAEVMARSKRLLDHGVIQEIGPIVDVQKIRPSVSTLVGIKVPEEKVTEVARIINQYSNISHNYLREHEYNIWFTLTAQSSSDIAKTLQEIKQKTALDENDILNLPTKNRFKIDVRFQFVNKLRKEEDQN